MMRLSPAGSMIMPATRLVVAGPLDDVLATLVSTMTDHGYRLRSDGGRVPLTFRRGSVASYALLGAARRPDRGGALYAVVTVQPTVLPDGDVHLALVQTRAHGHASGAAVLRAAVGDLAGRLAAAGTLRFAGRLRPARDAAHLEVVTEGAEGYRGERGPDGAPLPWAP